MATKNTKQVNVHEEIERCTNSKGEMTKIPVFSSITCLDGVLVGKLEGYRDEIGNKIIADTTTILH